MQSNDVESQDSRMALAVQSTMEIQTSQAGVKLSIGQLTAESIRDRWKGLEKKNQEILANKAKILQNGESRRLSCKIELFRSMLPNPAALQLYEPIITQKFGLYDRKIP